ncbi:MAG: hypothetical protein H0V29_06115 [Thermoleophilaceae bacterium]|nr:hypothetical protein [Thermoleophilaceae bacterium]
MTIVLGLLLVFTLASVLALAIGRASSRADESYEIHMREIAREGDPISVPRSAATERLVR